MSRFFVPGVFGAGESEAAKNFKKFFGLGPLGLKIFKVKQNAGILKLSRPMLSRPNIPNIIFCIRRFSGVENPNLQ